VSPVLPDRRLAKRRPPESDPLAAVVSDGRLSIAKEVVRGIDGISNKVLSGILRELGMLRIVERLASGAYINRSDRHGLEQNPNGREWDDQKTGIPKRR
jgi:hypothetical protein